MSAEAQIRAALEAAEARPPAAYLWFGRRTEVAAGALEAAICERLISDFYATGVPRPPAREPAAAGGAHDGGALARALSQANAGHGRWEPGWRVAARDGEAITVMRADGLALLAPAGDCRLNGDHAEVRVPKELRAQAPGWYVALSDAPGPGGARVRLSWNIAAAGAPTLVARLTHVLNGAGLPFELHVLGDPARYPRRDAAALLLARTDFTAAAKLLRPLLRALGPHLGEGAPALAKPLARGLAVAEEPRAGGAGFAEQRCGLLAAAVVAAGERGLRDPGERLALAHERFTAAGISFDAPHLDPGSADAYELS